MTEAPYGYTYIRRTDSCPAKLVINEAEADVVRQIFRWLMDEQLSTYRINQRLNESSIPTRHGKPRWAGGFLVNLLRNPIYTGTFYYNKRRQVQAQRKKALVQTQLLEQQGRSGLLHITPRAQLPKPVAPALPLG